MENEPDDDLDHLFSLDDAEQLAHAEDLELDALALRASYPAALETIATFEDVADLLRYDDLDGCDLGGMG